MNEKIDEYKERLTHLKESSKVSAEVESLVEEMMVDLVELNRSNKALRKAILKNGQVSTMSTRLRDALYE